MKKILNFFQKTYNYLENIYAKKTYPKPSKNWYFRGDWYKKGLTTTFLLTVLAVVLLVLAFVFGGILYGFGYLGGGLSWIGRYAIGAGIIWIAWNLADDRETKLILVAVGAFLAYAFYQWANEGMLAFSERAITWGEQQYHTFNRFEETKIFVLKHWVAIVLVIFAPAILIAAIAVLSRIVTGIFQGVEKATMKRFGVKRTCPECAASLAKAKYRCPSCNRIHKVALTPNAYGILSHECANCSTSLPTMWWQRKALKQQCPNTNCDITLDLITGTTKYIAFIGGIGVGKTCLLIQLTTELLTKHNAKIPDGEDDQKHYYQQIADAMKLGKPPKKTGENDIYRAFQIQLQKAYFPYHLHYYDIAGEHLEETRTSKVSFYKNLDSIVFLIDPHSISYFREQQKIEVGITRTEPVTVFDNLKQELDKYNKAVKKIKFNVVLVKSDLEYLPKEVKTIKLQETLNEALRRFIRNDLDYGHLIAKIEDSFELVNYYYLSALGRNPSEENKTPFVPDNLDFFIENMHKNMKVKIVKEEG